MNLGLEGTRALVTAASKGIGRACAAALVNEGAKVFITARETSALAKAAREIGAAGHLAADLATPGDPERAVEAAVQALGGLDILVLNFPQPSLGTLEQLAIEDWEAGNRGLLLCAVRAVANALPHLKASGRGRIVNITGIGVRQPSSGFIVSAAYRSAVTAFAKALSADVAKDGITVNNLAPGSVLTEQLRVRLTKPNPDELDRFAASIPAGRLGTPEEVGATCAFLCSIQAAYVTGQTIGIDGGALKGVH